MGILLLASMDDFDRKYLDKAIAALQGAAVGQIRITRKRSARAQGLASNKEQRPLEWSRCKFIAQQTLESQRLSPHERDSQDESLDRVFVSERCRFAASKHLALQGASKVRPGIR